MDVDEVSNWIDSLTVPDRIKVLALIYSRLTIYSRQLFFPDQSGNESRVLEVLHGLNEVHHTLANWLVGYAIGNNNTFPVSVLGRQLLEIEDRYQLQHYLTPSIEYIRTHPLPSGAPPHSQES
jgi:hypothetical protein